MRRSSRKHLLVAVAAVAGLGVLVGCSVLMINRNLSRIDLTPETTRPKPLDPSVAPRTDVPLGVELTADGSIHLHIPRCPESRATKVGWFDISHLGTFWSIDEDGVPAGSQEFVVGETPVGYRTSVDLESNEDVPATLRAAFVAERASPDGERLPSAAATLRRDELRVGQIVYHAEPGDRAASVASSVDEFNAAVGCR